MQDIKELLKTIFSNAFVQKIKCPIHRSPSGEPDQTKIPKRKNISPKSIKAPGRHVRPGKAKSPGDKEENLSAEIRCTMTGGYGSSQEEILSKIILPEILTDTAAVNSKAQRL